MLKEVKKFGVLDDNDVCLAAREATSAMSFLMPAMDTVRIGDAWCTCWRNARALHKWPPIIDFEEANLVAHATAGVLSQKMPTCACLRCIGLMFSNTIQASVTPPISRSAMARFPFLLLDVTRLSLISWGHSSRHTVGCMCIVPFIHTPPTPCFDASTYAMNHGTPGVSSRTEVGRDDMRLSKKTQSDRACFIAGVMLIMTFVPCIA